MVRNHWTAFENQFDMNLCLIVKLICQRLMVIYVQRFSEAHFSKCSVVLKAFSHPLKGGSDAK